MILEGLLSILACPACKGAIELDTIRAELLCHNCNLIFHIQDNIPVMLVDQAERVS